MYKTNYHIHNELCKHAMGTVMDYADKAFECGFDIIGMSDHAPFRGNPYGFRMDFEEFEEYIFQVKEAKRKYEKRMKVLLGLEIEYMAKHRSYYDELREKYNMEYLILGQHFFDDGHGNELYVYDLPDTTGYVDYAKSVEEALGTGLFSMVAHPDLMFVHDFEWDYNCDKACDIIVDAAVKYGVPLELNANGVRKGKSRFVDGDRYPYPHFKLFEKISDAKVPVMINSDCHQLKELDDEAMKMSHELVKEWNLIYQDVLELR